MAEGSSVQSHGVTMLSLVEKLEDLKVGLNNDTYIDVILQSLPPLYDPFIVNYNMNGLEKSIHELINMLVQYEATTRKSEPSVSVGEASTSKAKSKGARRWKRKKGKGTAVTATASTGVLLLLPRRERAKERSGVLSNQRQMMCAFIAMEKGHWKRECPQLLSHPGMFVVEINMISNSASWVLDIGCGAHICKVLQRSRKLSKDEMILRLGNGKAVAAEAVGSVSLVVSDHVRIELKDCYFVPSMGKMTKKPFVGQSAIAKGLLDLVHTDVCGPLSIPARGGFSYFITFTDDHSRYGYVYLMRSTRESRVPERYGFVGLTSQLDNDPKTYGEAMSDIDSDKWLEAMKSEMDSMDGRENGLPKRFLEEEIFMDQPEGFTTVGEEQKISGSSVAYLVLYVDDILLIGNDVKMLGDIKAWLSTQFSMKDMGEASYILGIKIYRDRSRRMLGLTNPRILRRPDVAYALSVTSRYQACAGEAHWSAVKSILKYLRRTKDMFLIYGGGELILEGYSDASFQSDDDDAKSNRILYSSLTTIAPTQGDSGKGDCRMDRVSSAENTADPLTKPISQVAHTQHLDKMGLRSMGDWL
ncbi:UNVERIFIED_CONTAM: Retrovirus-related Pol polyprotein from transposon RE2 [Sesamum latifolium]|uniref:Retrovirus-related Pol polyprotein from transposon RE2 n=1 Tax=Sesamum latifolium TaxID=2727402 RepID=A0AAW2UUY9_9LAMI